MKKNQDVVEDSSMLLHYVWMNFLHFVNVVAHAARATECEFKQNVLLLKQTVGQAG